MKIKKIAMIELDSKIPNFGNVMAMPRYGITAIGSILSKAKYEVKVFADIYGKVTLEEILEFNPDCIMFNGIKTSIDRIKDLAKQIKKKKRKIPIIIGGEEATLFPEEMKDFVDYIVLCEGDETILELLKSIESKKSFSKIKGIIYKKGKKWKQTELPDRITNIDYTLDLSIFRGIDYFGKKFLGRKYGITKEGRALGFPIQTSRGCFYRCAFCTQKTLFGKPGYFFRNTKDIIKDMDEVIKKIGVSNFQIVDNLFGGNPKQTMEFCEEVIKHFKNKEKKPKFTVLMRADQFIGERFTNKDLRTMFKAGVRVVSIGMESVNKETLKKIKHAGNLNVYIKATKRLNKFNIEVIGTFGVGGGDDTKDNISGIVEFSEKYGLGRIHLYVYTILPGTPDFLNKKYLMIKDVPNEYINGHGVAALPLKMLPSELQEGVINAMRKYYSNRRNNLGRKGLKLFYLFHLRRIRKSLKPHLKKLKKIERGMKKEGLYIKNKETGDWELDEEKIPYYEINYEKGIIQKEELPVVGPFGATTDFGIE